MRKEAKGSATSNSTSSNFCSITKENSKGNGVKRSSRFSSPMRVKTMHQKTKIWWRARTMMTLSTTTSTNYRFRTPFRRPPNQLTTSTTSFTTWPTRNQSRSLTLSNQTKHLHLWSLPVRVRIICTRTTVATWLISMLSATQLLISMSKILTQWGILAVLIAAISVQRRMADNIIIMGGKATIEAELRMYLFKFFTCWI